MAITPQPPAAIAVPNTLAPESAASVSAPNSSAASGVNPNLALYSEQFDNAAWSKSSATITADDTIAPDLAATADKLAAGSTASIIPRVFQSVGPTSASAYTISAFIKRSEAEFLQIFFEGSHVDNDPRVNFDLSAGTVGTQDADIDAASIVPVGGDWFRFWVTVTAASTSLKTEFALMKSAADTRAQASSWTAGDGLYIWGAQIEQATAPTTYVKTLGEAVTAGAVVIPNTLTGQSAASPAVPNTLAAESAASAAAPNTLTAQSAAAPAVPNTLTADAALSPAVPNSLTATDQTAFPRTLCPTVDLNYGAGLFAQNGAAIAEADLITYARASSATYLDRYTKGNKYEYFLNTDYVGTVENLISYSEDLATGGWGVAAATLTEVDEIAPDGARGVKKLVGDGTNAAHALYKPSQTITGNTYSIYIKSAGARYILLSSHYSSAPSLRGAFFDVVSGAFISAGAGISAKIMPVGDDWFRCSITEGDNASTIFSVNLSSDGSTLTYADDAESGVLVWGAQRSAGTSVLPYVKTTSTSASQTFAESQRIEYDAATGEKLGALIEQASTNLCLRSEEFDNASWTKSSSAITANDSIAPDLTTSADKLEAAAGGTITPRASQSVTTTAAEEYTISAFVKRSEASFLQIKFDNGHVANDPRVNFDLSGVAIGTQDADIDAASITPVGNDWLRISATISAVGAVVRADFGLIKSASDTRAQANSWTAGDGLYIWGAQIEQAAIPTSYIPTTTAAVSRLADQVSIPVAGNVPSGDITIFTDVYIIGEAAAVQYLYRVDGDYAINSYVSAAGDLIVKNGSADATAALGSSNFGLSFNVSNVHNSSLNTVTGFLNGAQTVSIDAGSQANPDPSAVVGIGNNSPVGTQQINGHIKRFTIYDEALTAAEVAQL